MKPDYSFELRFPINSRVAVIKSLGRFCINTSDDTFDPEFVTDDCSLCFVVSNQENFVDYYQYYYPIDKYPGKVWIGLIDLWIRLRDDYCEFTFWPVTKRMGELCLLSTDLLNAFQQLIIDHKGYEVFLDHGNGYLEPLFENPATS